ncbi:bifunctional UDP-N-acetylmuramoyl-tripeptide:D-alanyl-D-alanine ligase/alanine racemase [Mariniphaga sediminis]|nr:bifunctional UDP-N-acetylmuramoyl-tripeptide:D-alanyl-D-alanine ligase/alanine racemase [Mariniphaga sediminis]
MIWLQKHEMIEYTLSEIATIVHGKLVDHTGFSDQKIKQIVTDSRTFFKGENALFFALTGPRNNGHKYISNLEKKGLNAFVVSDASSITPDAAFIQVEDTTKALQHLAEYHRKKFQYPVVGITGSNGKTIVKEWLHELLSEEFRIVRSPKSYNSQIGVPLSVLLMDNHFNLGILEAGISKSEEMKKLAPIIQPEIGILTNIGDAHQENFQSKQQKTEEKLLLFSKAKKLVFCVDDKNTTPLVQAFCKSHGVEAVSWTRQNNKALIQFTTYQENGNTTLEARISEKKYHFKIPFTDASSVENACHCFATAWILSENTEKILSRFGQLAPVAMRLEIKQGINNCLLINDYYNSDLASLSIALSVLHQQAKKGHKKKQVILSDIQQTGIPEDELYRQVNHLLQRWEIDRLVGIGPKISAHQDAFSLQKAFYPSTEDFEQEFLRTRFSDSIILIKGARAFTFEKISSLLQQKAHQTVLEIDLNALVHNLNIFRGLLHPSTKTMVMVKAFSYGTGDVEIAKLLQFQNVDYLAVAVADEGVELRQAGIQIPLIVMNPEEHSFQHIIDYRLEPNIYSIKLLEAFEEAVDRNALQQFPIHLKLETGMNRLGFKTEEEIESILSSLEQNNRLKIVSVFSHLATSDDPTFDDFTHEQFQRFDVLSDKIISRLPYKIDRHILNSSGIERFPGKQMEMVRLGIGLYGVSVTGLPLQNISTFKSIISQIKKLKPGETVGYSRKGQIERETEIAVVPVGYADGLDRKLGNSNGEAYLKGQRVPVIGNICMDMLMLDVTDLKAQPGDSVEFFGPHISISEVAQKTATIPYEVLTGISQRVKRVYLHE